MSFPRYPEYKDSGVEWLGEVPAHWDLLPIKANFCVIGGSTPKSDVEAYWDGEIIWVTPADLSKLSSLEISESQRRITEQGLNSCGTNIVPTGAIILSTRAPIGSLAISARDLCTNQGCKSLVPRRGLEPRYFAYLLSAGTEALILRGKGTTFLELSGDELASFKMVSPRKQEQNAIATFLGNPPAD